MVMLHGREYELQMELQRLQARESKTGRDLEVSPTLGGSQAFTILVGGGRL